MDEAVKKEVQAIIAKQLTTAYAYSNLERAILRFLLVDLVAKEGNRAQRLQEYYGSIRDHLSRADFPPNDPNSEEIRLESLRLAQEFFRDIESGFELLGIKLEKKLKL